MSEPVIAVSIGHNNFIRGDINITIKEALITDETPPLIRYKEADPIFSFVGRRKTFQDIDHALQTAGNLVVNKTIVLTGTAGIGKTEAAKKYIKDNFAHCPERNIVWLEAENHNTLNSEIQQLANIILKRPITNFEAELDAIIREIHAALFARDCVLVFNNAETFVDEPRGNQGIKRYFPTAANPPLKQPVIIITTRKRKGWEGMTTMELPDMNMDECKEFICTQLSTVKNVEVDWEGLAKFCAGLPVALKYASASIQLEVDKNKDYTIANFLREFEDDKLFSDEHEDNPDVPASLRLLWARTFYMLDNNSSYPQGKLALRMLEIIACLAPSGIPADLLLKLLSHLVPDLPEKDQKDARLLLISLSFVSTGKVFTIHRLLQSYCYQRLKSSASHFAAFLPQVSEKFQRIVDEIQLNDPTYSTVMQNLYAFTKASEPAVESPAVQTLHVKAAEILQHVNFTSALAIAQKLVPVLSKNTEETTVNLATRVKICLANLLRRGGKLEDALRIFQEIYQVQCAAVGESNGNAMQTRHNVGLVHRDQHKYGEALSIFQEVYEKRCVSLGPTEAATLESKLCIANVYHHQRKLEDALRIYTEVYQQRKTTLGDRHFDTLRAHHSIGIVYRDQGNFEEAHRIYDDVYRKRCDVLGPTHADTLAIKNSIAIVLHDLGDIDGSLRSLQELYDTRSECLGPKHPDTLRTRFTMGLTYLKHARYQEALEVLVPLYEKRCDTLGPTHPNTLHTRHSIGEAYANLDKYDEACAVFEEVYKDRSNVLGASHADTLLSASKLERCRATMVREIL